MLAGGGGGGGAGAAGVGVGVGLGLGDGDGNWLGVGEGVGVWTAGAAATEPIDGEGVPRTAAGPETMAATTIAMRAKGATMAETYPMVATTIFHVVFERYPGTFLYHDDGGVAAA